MVLDVTVVGSVNLDLVARVERLPRPGESLTARAVTRHPGGKGANQALAAARLGASVRLVAAVGADPLADEALTLLRADGVDLQTTSPADDVATGTAMIQVDDAGETTIVVDAGANATLRLDRPPAGDVVVTVLEVPDAVVATAMRASGFTVLNAAPARPVDDAVLAALDLLVVNADEHDALARSADLDGIAAVAVTHGADGAELRRPGRTVTRVESPRVDTVDGTAAGDAFTAALALGLAGGQPDEDALRRACLVGAITATRAGAQPSLPRSEEVDAWPSR